MSLEKCRLDVKEKLKHLNKDEFAVLVQDIEDIILRSEKTGKDVSKVIREFSQIYRQKIVFLIKKATTFLIVAFVFYLILFQLYSI